MRVKDALKQQGFTLLNDLIMILHWILVGIRKLVQRLVEVKL